MCWRDHNERWNDFDDEYDRCKYEHCSDYDNQYDYGNDRVFVGTILTVWRDWMDGLYKLRIRIDLHLFQCLLFSGMSHL